MSRYDLSDFEWRVIEPLLPNKPRGVPRIGEAFSDVEFRPMLAEFAA
jgi:transposase